MNTKGQGPPAIEAYAEMQHAFDFMNAELFDNALNGCLITFARKRGMVGYLSQDRFVHKGSGARASELALNPSFFAIQPLMEILQTLVHEMCHEWQGRHGKPGRRGYHNKEWADKMEAIGLMPSSTGREGGKRTGEHMADYAIPGGRFEVSAKKLMAAGFRVSWLDRYPARAKPTDAPDQVLSPEGSDDDEGDELEDLTALGIDLNTQDDDKKRSTMKYRCTDHKVNVWGKPGLKVACGVCMTLMEEV